MCVYELLRRRFGGPSLCVTFDSVLSSLFCWVYLLAVSQQPSVCSFHLYAVAVQLSLKPRRVLSTENKTKSVAVHRRGSHRFGFEVKIINGEVRMLSLPRSRLADEQNEKMSLVFGL